MAPGSICPTSYAYVPRANTAERKILTAWHPVWHLPILRAEPLKITTWAYNGDNSIYCAPMTAKVGVNPIGVLCQRTEQGTTDTTGGAGYTAVAVGNPRIWKYKYNSLGQVLTIDGPRTDVADVTTYSYYPCSTGAKCGQIYQIQNAAGQVTTVNTYNGNGQPLTITDPNGVITTLGYDPRYRLHTKQISAPNEPTFSTENTTYDYWPTGQLKKVTLSDLSFLTISYNAGHQLTALVPVLRTDFSFG